MGGKRCGRVEGGREGWRYGWVRCGRDGIWKGGGEEVEVWSEEWEGEVEVWEGGGRDGNLYGGEEVEVWG